ncbi:hypothetical protein [Pseudomonas carnis]|nr:hypothetical protein [Pseudomonas carnis]
MQFLEHPLDPQLINIRRLFPSPLASIQFPDVSVVVDAFGTPL